MNPKIDFAWFLFPDGISLLHRQRRGHWAKLGTAALDSGDLPGELAHLRAQAVERGGNEFRAKLVLPSEQVLYTTIAAPGPDDPARLNQIRLGLNGRTPYAVDDLVYDWRIRDADMVQVAVVARETVEEAEGFAREHRLNPAAFVAIPEGRKFLGEPLFGIPDSAPAELHRKGLSPEPQAITIGPDLWQPPEPEPEAPKGVFSTAGLGAMQPGRPAAAPRPRPTVAAPARETTVDAPPDPDDGPIRMPAGFGARRRTQKPTEDPAAMPDPATAGTQGRTPRFGVPAPAPTPAPVPDPASGHRPDPDMSEAPPAPAPATPPDPATTEDGPDNPAGETQPAARGDAADRPAGPAPAEPASSPVTATRGPSEAPAEQKPVRAARGTAEAPAAAGKAGLRAETERPAGGKGRKGARAERGGKAKAPKRGRDLRIGDRGTKDSPAPGPVTPETAPPPTPAPRIPATSGPAPADLAAAIAAPLPHGGGGPPPSEPGPISQLAMRLRHREPRPPRLPDNPPADDPVMTGGLLARRADVVQNGGSARTGLILTLILILLLALVAIWSALFLPDSQVARLIWGEDAPVLVDDPAAEADADPEALAAAELDRFLGTAGDGSLGEDAIGDDDPALRIAEDGSIAAPAQPSPDELADVEPIVLPDIDADLPEVAAGTAPLPSLEETEAFYAVSGIWQRPPDLGAATIQPEPEDALFRVAIEDPAGPSDPFAVARPQLPQDLAAARRVPNPPPFGQTFELDANGDILPQPGDGVWTPDGVRVIEGRPAVAPGPRGGEATPPSPPTVEETDAGTDTDTTEIDPDRARLAAFLPVPRPDDLAERRERQVLGGVTRAELAAFTPVPRPASVQELAAGSEDAAQDLPPDADAASIAAGAIDAAVALAVEAAEGTGEDGTAAFGGTELAVSISPRPTTRPDAIDRLVAEARAAEPAAPATPAAPVEAADVAEEELQDNEPDSVVEPNIPTAATVTRAATEEGVINLRQVALIGVSGTPSDREALVRLPSGRFVRVGIGDRLDRGRVAAIGESSLQYVRNGQSITLQMP